MCVVHTDSILGGPLVDGLRGMCHVDLASKVGLGEDVRQ